MPSKRYIPVLQPAVFRLHLFFTSLTLGIIIFKNPKIFLLINGLIESSASGAIVRIILDVSRHREREPVILGVCNELHISVISVMVERVERKNISKSKECLVADWWAEQEGT